MYPVCPHRVCRRLQECPCMGGKNIVEENDAGIKMLIKYILKLRLIMEKYLFQGQMVIL